MNRFQFFTGIPAMPQAEREIIHCSYDTVKRWHANQWRDGDEERYFEHLRGVAQILIDLGCFSAHRIAVHMLHDLPEDQNYSPVLLERTFGPEIARDVLTMCKSYGIPDPITGFLHRIPKREDPEYFAGILAGGEVTVVGKGADRLYNQRDLVDPPKTSEWYNPQRRLDKIAHTRRWILPPIAQYSPRLDEMLAHSCNIVEVSARAAAGSES